MLDELFFMRWGTSGCPECSPYVAANALEMLGAKAVIFGYLPGICRVSAGYLPVVKRKRFVVF